MPFGGNPVAALMDGDRDNTVQQCADYLASVLREKEGGGGSTKRTREDRDEAVSFLRGLSNEALLATLHKLYGAGASEVRPRSRRKKQDKKSIPRVPERRRPAGAVMWLTTAVLGGIIVMAMEIVAFRLYAPYLGYSIYVWGTMISMVMAALAIGYALGGRLADRSADDRPLYVVIMAGALYQLVIALTVRSFLPALAPLGDFAGTAVASLVIFAPPMACLATVSPYVIRLMTRTGHAGSTAGKVYALSTAGSIAGILLASFVLIPGFGTLETMSMACGASFVLGVAGLARRRRAALSALILLAALPFAAQTEWPESTVWAGESAYNLVRVVQEGSETILILNDERSVATRRDEQRAWTDGYYDDFALGPLLVPVRRALVLGMGAGGSITSMRATAPDVEIDAVEIDGLVVEAAYGHFGLNRDDERLNVHIADARPWVARCDRLYDFVHVDLYQGGPNVAFYLTTEEFFASVRARMTDAGLMMMNVVDIGPRHELLSSTVATLNRAFPAVFVFARRTGNNMILAFASERSLESVRTALAGVEGDDMLSRHARQVAQVVVEFVPPGGTPIFTDDLTPIERMTRRMLKNASVAQ